METRADFFYCLRALASGFRAKWMGGWDSRQSQPMPEQVYKMVSPVESPEDLALLEDFLAGSPAAFTAIYDRFYPSLFVLASRYVFPTEAEDVCADCFVKLWLSEKDFNSIRGLGGYLRIMVRNACISIRRKNASAARREAEFSSFNDDSLSENIWEERCIRLHKAMSKLPPGARKIIELAFLDGKKNQEIARRLEISKNTVLSQKARAIKILREMLTIFF